MSCFAGNLITDNMINHGFFLCLFEQDCTHNESGLIGVKLLH